MRWHHLMIVLACASGLCLGCQEPESWVRPALIEGPKGGSALALAQGSGGAIYAISNQNIYERTQARWQALEATWKTSGVTTREVLGSFTQSLGVAAASNHERFVRHGQTLWLLSYHHDSSQNTLHLSRDEGRSWEQVALPLQLSTRNAHLNAITSPRLTSTSAGLFLIGDQHIWQIDITDDTVDASTLKVSLLGVSLGRSGLGQGLPLTLRHYLPADAARPYEVLSVLGEQLFVYRRTAPQKAWTLTTTLNTVDLNITPLPNRQELMMVSPKGILLGSDHAEQWTRREISLLDPEETVTATLYKSLGSEPSSDAGMFIAGTSAGAIYVSETGSQWRQTRPADPSRRAITDLLAETQTASIWASTDGQGLLRSQDTGQTWTDQSEGFESAALHVGLSRSEGTYWGTNAGLFRRSDQQWSPLVNYSTSALAEGKAGDLIIGTTNGHILRMKGNAVLETRSPDYQTVRDGPRFEPHTRWSRALPSEAILGIFDAQEKVHVMTHGKGRLSITSEAKIEVVDDAGKGVLQEALQGARITSVVDVNGVLLFSTQSILGDIPTQLWRSNDQGKTWQAIISLEQGNASRTTRIFLRPDGPYVIHQGVLYKLLINQAMLKKVALPWDGAESILDYATSPEEDVALTFSNRTLKLHTLAPNLDLEESFEVRWEKGTQATISRSWFIVPQGEYLYLSDGDVLYKIDLARSNQDTDQAFPLMLSILAIVVTASIGFGLFKRYV